MLSEEDLLGMLTSGAITTPPLELRLLSRLNRKRGQPLPGPDAFLQAEWRGRRYRFAVECKSRSTPRVITEALAQAQAVSDPPRLLPMIMVPFLSRTRLLELEQAGVSGIDACGNAVIIVPQELFVLRTGSPNKYPDSVPLKNVFRGDASLVPRMLLVHPYFHKVGDVRDAIRDRGGNIALSTVSKALRRLEDDLIVSRDRHRVRLLQRDKLFAKLAENYRPPELTLPPVVGRCSLPVNDLKRELVDIGRETGVRIAATGTSSIHQYATMAREDKMAVYCSEAAEIFNRLTIHIELTHHFANFELHQTKSETAYFDARSSEDDPYPWASPTQTYLELMAGDKRDRETAAQVACWIRDHNADYEWGHADGLD